MALLSIAAAALFAVLVPIHVALHGTVLPVTLLLGAALCGSHDRGRPGSNFMRPGRRARGRHGRRVA